MSSTAQPATIDLPWRTLPPMSLGSRGNASAMQLSQAATLQETSLLLTRRIRRHSGTGLTLSQMSVLSTLQRFGTMRVSDLAEREQLRKSSVTRLVAKLEAMDYLARVVDPRDGRSFHITITEHGHELLAESSRRASEFLVGEMHKLSESDRAALAAALPALKALVTPGP